MYLAYKDTNILFKILPCLLIAIFLVMILSSCCFAVMDISYEDITITLSDNICSYKYIFLCKYFWNYDGKNYLELVCSNTPITFDTTENTMTLTSESYFFGNNTLLYSDYNKLSTLECDSFSGFSYNNARHNLSNCDIIYCNTDVVDTTGKIYYETPKTSFIAPSFITSKEELESGKFDYLKVSSGDFNTFDNKDFYLFSYYYSDDVNDIDSIYPRKEILLDGSSNKYFVGWADDDTYRYDIPFGELGVDLKEGYQYGFKLASKNSDGIVTDYWTSVVFSIGELSDVDKQLNSDAITQGKLDEQTNAIKENTETNKNIFEKIGEVLSYINPFSENFFVYKLIELLIEAIKSLFIPSDEFLGSFFDNLKNWFSDRLGFLFYPFELILDVLDKIVNINFSEPVFNIPDIKEPFTNSLLISATEFNLNDMLGQSVFKTVHDIYLVIVDAFIIFELVNLAKRKYEGVTDK